MSNVILNAIDQDITAIDFFQHGQNHTETTLREELLDGEKSYHFACTHLSVPLKHVPIHPVAADTTLFRVRRRVAGVGVNSAQDTPYLAPAISTFTVSPSRPQYSVSEFVQALQQYCENLNRNLTTDGLDNNDFALLGGAAVAAVVIEHEGDVKRYLDIIASCDSSLLVTPGENFYQYFVLEFTAYGASILGINLDDLHKQGDSYFLTPTDDSYTTAPFDENGDWVASANTDDANPVFTAHHPVYSTADQRVKISVSSHLPLLSNVLVNNEKQSSERDIAEAFFENQVKSEVRYSDGVFSTRLISKIYSGQAAMIRKHDSHHQWNKLLSSYRLRYMRFFLFVTYRDYQDSTNTFVLRKMPVTVDPHDYWNFSIKFVSDT